MQSTLPTPKKSWRGTGDTTTPTEKKYSVKCGNGARPSELNWVSAHGVVIDDQRHSGNGPLRNSGQCPPFDLQNSQDLTLAGSAHFIRLFMLQNILSLVKGYLAGL
jgi:hypothetical protein